MTPPDNNADLGAILQQANHCLQARQLDQAGNLCRKVLDRAPGQPDALHLLSSVMLASGRPAEAEKLFRKSLASAPRRPDILVNYGNFLRKQGRPQEAHRPLRKAVKLAPDFVPAWHGLGLTLFKLESYKEAARSAQKLTELAPDFPSGWELLASIEQKRGDLAAAIAACRAGLRHSPRAPRLMYSLAQLLRQECEFEEASSAYEAARKQGYESPDLYRNRTESLLEAGAMEQALECAAAGVLRYPEDPLLQRTRARLHFESGAEGDPTAMLARTAREHPRNAALWATLGQLLNRLDRQDECREMIREAVERGCPVTPDIQLLDALASVHIGASQEATAKFDKLLANDPQHTTGKLRFAEHLLSSGDPARAETLSSQVLQVNPSDQLAWTYLGTAWRLLGDPREDWLMDYERMVKPVPVPVPEGFTDRTAFFYEVQRSLEALHRTEAHPIEQTLRGGTQTNGFLFRHKDPLLGQLEQQIRLAVLSVLADFPQDAQHPFWGRRVEKPGGDGFRFSGAWSVRLRSEGFHTNHMHPEGWISSALYIALPDEVLQGEGDAGHIQFGVPLGMDLPARRIVRPEVGTLVLFPSYMWHGTVPFTSQTPRITVAFDLVPER